MNTGLYIHVPFCVRKCPYCDFYSVSSHDSDLYEKYTQSVLKNIKRYTSEYSDIIFDTVYFGGGTPSLMPVSFFHKILEKTDNISSDAEITMELNPKTADSDKLKDLRNSGINRLSVGIQSAVDSELKDLGRIHTYAEAENIIHKAHEAGFENVSADLMIGIKGQDRESLVKSVDSLAALPLRHISSYLLKIEEGTEYYRCGMADNVPDEDEAAEMYLLAVSKLEEKGFFQYEISNFSKPGYESRHNLKYWHCEEYIGIGPSAHSYFNGKRYGVPRNLSDFLISDKQNEIISEEDPGDFFEKAMLALRLTEGLDLKKYPEYADAVLSRAERFRKAGLLSTDDRIIRFKPEGFLISNMLISDLLSEF